MAAIDSAVCVRRALRHGVLLMAVGMLQGCQVLSWFQAPLPLDPRKRVDIVAALDVNPNLHGRPSPVVLTLYQLSDARTFLKADLSRLADGDEPPVDAAWLARETFQVSPGEWRKHLFVPHPQTRLVGVVAEYRDLDNAQWRAVDVFQAQSPEALRVSLGRDVVSIQAIPLQEDSTHVQQ
uniref:type VI secretion system lipoprotein TssJ n=1 Tax=Pseudomonas laurentiana TaxID=2364649 RepID=UPI0029C8AA3D|nr:type VI secretion system lipoprotein TssJ [Pseudomonas laurentiana]